MPHMKKFPFRVFLLIATLVTAAGCGEVRSGLPAAGEIDVRHLDVGPYSTEPIDTYKEYSHSVANGFESGIIRLTNHTATGLDIDPKLKFGTGTQSIAPLSMDTTANVSDVEKILSKAGAAAAVRNKVMFGFASGSSDHEPDRSGTSMPAATLVTLGVMQFPTEADAARAAGEIEQADFDVARDANRSVQLKNFPEAHSHWQPGTPTLGSLISRSRYVVSLFVQVPDGGLPDIEALAEKAYAKQLPMLDALPPLSASDAVKLDPDTDGMLRRIINPNKLYTPASGSLATYDEQGFLHFQNDRAAAKSLFEATHLDRFTVSDAYIPSAVDYSAAGNAQAFGKGIFKNATGGAILYRSSGAASAADAYSRLLEAPDARMSPKNVPDSKCAQLPDSGNYRQFSCAVRYHNFVAVVWGRQLDDAQQRAAAQYALLANSEWM